MPDSESSLFVNLQKTKDIQLLGPVPARIIIWSCYRLLRWRLSDRRTQGC